MVDHLSQYQNMTFQWAEMVFLERWFRDITPETKSKVSFTIQTFGELWTISTEKNNQ